MQRALIVLAILLYGVMTMAAGSAVHAGERPDMWRYNKHSSDAPYPRSHRSQSVWASGQCWSECGSYCAWGMAGCLERNAQGACLKAADACDRYCQRTCRPLFSGGPFLPYIDLPLIDYPVVK